MREEIQLIDIVSRSRPVFFRFVEECNDQYRSGDDLAYYRKIIDYHNKKIGIANLIEDDAFIKLVYATLEKWDMNVRAAKMTSLDRFARSIKKHGSDLVQLYKHNLTDVDGAGRVEILGALQRVFTGLEVMKSRRRIVGVSKTLHFLLPNLIMPVDSKFTMQYYYGYNKYADNAKKEFADFTKILMRTKSIVDSLRLTSDDLKSGGWNTSLMKLTDNAMIGMDLSLKDRSAAELLDMIATLDPIGPEERKTFEVLLSRKKKSEANPQREVVRIKLILQKAKAAGITASDDEVSEYLHERSRSRAQE